MKLGLAFVRPADAETIFFRPARKGVTVAQVMTPTPRERIGNCILISNRANREINTLAAVGGHRGRQIQHAEWNDDGRTA